MNRFLIWFALLPAYALFGVGMAALQSTNGIIPFAQSFPLILPTWLIGALVLWLVSLAIAELADWMARRG